MSDIAKPLGEAVIPAQPGWVVVTLICDEAGNSKGLCRIPVIAWLVQLYRRPTDETFARCDPITVDGSLDDVQDIALQYGDQPQFFTVHEEFTDEATLLAYFEKSEKSRRVV
jgi:hypothetical protein